MRLALRLCDDEDTEILTRDEVELTLAVMNRTLGFLGDPVRETHTHTWPVGRCVRTRDGI